jgi:hypothetical protein
MERVSQLGASRVKKQHVMSDFSDDGQLSTFTIFCTSNWNCLKLTAELPLPG